MAKDTFSINSPDLEKLIGKYNYLGNQFTTVLIRGTNKGLKPMERLLKTKYLNGVILKVRTGRLRASVRGWVESFKGTVFGYIGSSVKYAPPHEFGFKGIVKVGEYIRSDGTPVRAHSKFLVLKERKPFRKAVRAEKEIFLKILMREIIMSFAKGKGAR